jgi:hypothetical protein
VSFIRTWAKTSTTTGCRQTDGRTDGRLSSSSSSSLSSSSCVCVCECASLCARDGPGTRPHTSRHITHIASPPFGFSHLAIISIIRCSALLLPASERHCRGGHTFGRRVLHSPPFRAASRILHCHHQHSPPFRAASHILSIAIINTHHPFGRLPTFSTLPSSHSPPFRAASPSVLALVVLLVNESGREVCSNGSLTPSLGSLFGDAQTRPAQRTQHSTTHTLGCAACACGTPDLRRPGRRRPFAPRGFH